MSGGIVLAMGIAMVLVECWFGVGIEVGTR